MDKAEINRRLNAEERVTHAQTGRVIFKTVRGYYVVHLGPRPALYSGANLNDALRVWEGK